MKSIKKHIINIILLINRVIQKFSSRKIPIGDNYYGEKALIYDKHRENSNFWKLEDHFFDEAFRKLDNVEKVLDIPCGTGRFINSFINKNVEIVGADISNDMLNLFKKKWSDLAPQINVTSIKCDALKIPYPDKHFDLSISFRFLPWIVSFGFVKSFLFELKRVTKSYLILEFCIGKNSNITNLGDNSIMWNNFTHNDIIDFLSKYSIEVEWFHTFYSDEEHPGLSIYLCKIL
jgi:ubiquinone/menaquinone biosynthesis C-methylase UbiE